MTFSRNKKIVMTGALVGVLCGFTQTPASADSWYSRRSGPRQELQRDRQDIREGRQELRRDYQELQRDRQELRQDLRRGAGPREIARDRAEIRQDRREIARDRRDLNRDIQEYRRDMRDYDDRYVWDGYRWRERHDWRDRSWGWREPSSPWWRWDR
jgi:septal ring factor EnvC (AmiA/AmiB activator)